LVGSNANTAADESTKDAADDVAAAAGIAAGAASLAGIGGSLAGGAGRPLWRWRRGFGRWRLDSALCVGFFCLAGAIYARECYSSCTNTVMMGIPCSSFGQFVSCCVVL
jgi:hypothetical protein